MVLVVTRPLAGCGALVTGASSGIGVGIARALAAEGAGVALVARDGDRLADVARSIEAAGGRAVVVPADVTVSDEPMRAVERAVLELGRLDVLVNNAGVALPGSMVDAPESEWARMIDVNLTGLLSVSRAALPHLLVAARDPLRGVADLVNISSVAGRRAPLGAGVYAATKAGVIALSESLRQEVTARHVRVGLIEPGAVMIADSALRSEQTAKVDPDAMRASEIELLAVEDIAAAVVFVVTRPRRMAVNEILIRPTEQVK